MARCKCGKNRALSTFNGQCENCWVDSLAGKPNLIAKKEKAVQKPPGHQLITASQEISYGRQFASQNRSVD